MAFRKFVSLYSTSVSKPSSSISPSTARCREFIVVDKLAMVRILKEQGGLPSDLAETILNSSEATLYSTSSKGHGVEEVPSDVKARMKSRDAQEEIMAMVWPILGYVVLCAGAAGYKCLTYIWDEERWFGHKEG